MTPDKFIEDFKQIINNIVIIDTQAKKIAHEVATYTPVNVNNIELLRMKMCEQFDILALFIDKCKNCCDKLGSIIAEYQARKPPVTACEKRWIFTNGIMREATLEEVAEAEGITPEEQLRRETAAEEEADALQNDNASLL